MNPPVCIKSSIMSCFMLLLEKVSAFFDFGKFHDFSKNKALKHGLFALFSSV